MGLCQEKNDTFMNNTLYLCGKLILYKIIEELIANGSHCEGKRGREHLHSPPIIYNDSAIPYAKAGFDR